MPIRILIDATLFLTILLLPPIFPIVISLFLLYFFEDFYEIIFVGMIIDALYGKPIVVLYDFSHPMTFIFTTLFVASFFIKKKLKFYPNK